MLTMSETRILQSFYTDKPLIGSFIDERIVHLLDGAPLLRSNDMNADLANVNPLSTGQILLSLPGGTREDVRRE